MKSTINSSQREQHSHKKLRGVAILTRVLLVAGLLNGCEGVHTPHLLKPNEVPDDVLAAPRTVAEPPTNPAAEYPWPRLGDVPSKPKDFFPKDIADTVKDLQDQRDQAHQLRAQDDVNPDNYLQTDPAAAAPVDLTVPAALLPNPAQP